MEAGLGQPGVEGGLDRIDPNLGPGVEGVEDIEGAALAAPVQAGRVEPGVVGLGHQLLLACLLGLQVT